MSTSHDTNLTDVEECVAIFTQMWTPYGSVESVTDDPFAAYWRRKAGKTPGESLHAVTSSAPGAGMLAEALARAQGLNAYAAPGFMDVGEAAKALPGDREHTVSNRYAVEQVLVVTVDASEMPALMPYLQELIAEWEAEPDQLLPPVFDEATLAAKNSYARMDHGLSHARASVAAAVRDADGQPVRIRDLVDGAGVSLTRVREIVNTFVRDDVATIEDGDDRAKWVRLNERGLQGKTANHRVHQWVQARQKIILDRQRALSSST